MTSSLAKSKQIIGLHYIKNIRPYIYFNNQKIIAYHF